MRRLFSAAVLVVLVVTVSTSAATARTRKAAVHKCPNATSRLLAADSQAKVYLALEPSEPDFVQIYGCTSKTKRVYLLGEPMPRGGSPSGISGISLVTLSGTMVAFEAASGAPTGAEWSIVVEDLRTGKAVYSSPTGTPPHPPENENGLTRSYYGIGNATAIVLKSNGSVAWIAENTQLSQNGKYYEVHALDKFGSRTLASGTDIDPGSLALAGSTLYWTRHGAAASTTLQ